MLNWIRDRLRKLLMADIEGRVSALESEVGHGKHQASIQSKISSFATRIASLESEVEASLRDGPGGRHWNRLLSLQSESATLDSRVTKIGIRVADLERESKVLHRHIVDCELMCGERWQSLEVLWGEVTKLQKQRKRPAPRKRAVKKKR